MERREEDHPGTKLCDEQVIAMRKMRVERDLTTSELARYFGVSQSLAWQIVANKARTNVENPYPLIPKVRDRFKKFRKKETPVKPKPNNLEGNRISFAVEKKPD